MLRQDDSNKTAVIKHAARLRCAVLLSVRYAVYRRKANASVYICSTLLKVPPRFLLDVEAAEDLQPGDRTEGVRPRVCVLQLPIAKIRQKLERCGAYWSCDFLL